VGKKFGVNVYYIAIVLDVRKREYSVFQRGVPGVPLFLFWFWLLTFPLFLFSVQAYCFHFDRFAYCRFDCVSALSRSIADGKKRGFLEMKACSIPINISWPILSLCV